MYANKGSLNCSTGHDFDNERPSNDTNLYFRSKDLSFFMKGEC